MASIEPKKVDPQMWKIWSRLALELQTKGWLSNIIITLLIFVLFVLILKYFHWFAALLVALIVAPFLICVYLINAVRSDGYNIRMLLKASSVKKWIYLSVLGISGWLIFLLLLCFIALFIFLFSLFLFGGDVNTYQQQEMISNAVLANSLFKLSYPFIFFASILFFVCPLAAFYAQSLFPFLSIWFVIPLVLFFDLDIKHAYSLSRRAEQINFLLINSLILISLIGITLILFSGGLLAIIVMPFLAALHFVSFRDVFLSQFEQLSELHKASAKISLTVADNVTSA